MLDIQRMYDDGFPGIVPDRDADARLQSFGYATADEALTAFGIAEVGAGKIILPYLYALKYYGENALSGPGQGRGSCVAHCRRNCNVVTTCTEAASGVPDEVSGKVEEPPEVPEDGIKNGVMSTESVYWFRNHSDDGWWSTAAADASVKHTGAVVRKKYSSVDLTRYDAKLEGKYWKREQIPDDIYEEINDNKFRDAAACKSYEAIRDCLAVGIAVASDGPEGFSGKRDANGVMDRRGQWMHAMAVVGALDTDEVKKAYGGPLLLILNSWSGAWGEGPRTVMGSTELIPRGSFWARWSDVKNREYTAVTGLNGWARRALPDLNPGWQ